MKTWSKIIIIIIIVLGIYLKSTNINIETEGKVKKELVVEEEKMGHRHPRSFEAPVVMGDESLMSKKSHGTCTKGPQEKLKYNTDRKKADEICCFNRHYAEHSGYAFKSSITWLSEIGEEPVEYFDSIYGKRVFKGPVGRSLKEFIVESRSHGWPSFRDAEVDWDNVRILPDGECVTKDGVHLGHNIPDKNGNRYCINLVCIAGHPQ